MGSLLYLPLLLAISSSAPCYIFICSLLYLPLSSLLYLLLLLAISSSAPCCIFLCSLLYFPRILSVNDYLGCVRAVQSPPQQPSTSGSFWFYLVIFLLMLVALVFFSWCCIIVLNFFCVHNMAHDMRMHRQCLCSRRFHAHLSQSWCKFSLHMYVVKLS